MKAPYYPTSAFAYDLPSSLIATHPTEQRDASRLLVLDRDTGALEHGIFHDIAEMIPAGDVLVLNETRVIPARIMGQRPGGGAAEVLLLAQLADPATTAAAPSRGEVDGNIWEALVRPGAKLRAGRMISVAEDFEVEVLDVLANGNRVVRLVTDLPISAALSRYGRMPLPPYIDREVEAADVERYQTVYSREEGSVAAPTAGLHFTQPVLDRLIERGVRIARIVLHVGVGTFRPVEVEDPSEHVMHEERFSVSEHAAQLINDARANDGSVWAVGTTVTRTLESIASEDGTINACDGTTALFIRPGYRFRVVEHLLTNFHLPKSTLLMLVTAFGGYDNVMRAYATAVADEYRFYSYGDAMVIV